MTNKGLQVEDILAKDEEIIWQGKPARGAYITRSLFRHIGLIFLGLFYYHYN